MGILICRPNGTGKSTLRGMLADRMEYEFTDNEEFLLDNMESYLLKSSQFAKIREN